MLSSPPWLRASHQRRRDHDDDGGGACDPSVVGETGQPSGPGTVLFSELLGTAVATFSMDGCAVSGGELAVRDGELWVTGEGAIAAVECDHRDVPDVRRIEECRRDGCAYAVTDSDTMVLRIDDDDAFSFARS